MATITVKNIPDELYMQLKASAEANRRSINSEILVCIERRVSSQRLTVEATLEKAYRLRKLTSAYPITDAEFTEAKANGRP